MKALGVILLSAVSAWGAGAVTSSLATIPGPGGAATFVLTYSWTGDSSTGSVPATASPALSANPFVQGYFMTAVTITPGTPSPTAGYAVTVKDANGYDWLAGQAAALSATAPASYANAAAPPLSGSLTLAVTGNSVASAQGSVVVYFANTRTTSNSGWTDDGTTITAQAGRNVQVGGNLAIGTTVLTTGQAIDVVCSGDVTTAVQAAINALAGVNGSGSGGTVRLSRGTCNTTAQVAIPNDGGSPTAKQPAIRLTGQGGCADGRSFAPTGGAQLTLSYDSGPKIFSAGSGLIEIDHIALLASPGTTSAIFQAINTTPLIHDSCFLGDPALTAFANTQDAVVLGGTGTAAGNVTTSYFQGYGGGIHHNWFNHIRRAVLANVAVNGFNISYNTVWNGAGSNLTTTISGCTNATPTVCTSAAHGFAVGDVVAMNLTGFTGSWTPVNGAHNATYVSATTFSIAVDATAFGAVTGSPAYYSGAAFEIQGTSGGGVIADVGNVVEGNLVEMVGYPYAFRCGYCVNNNFTNNTIFDAGANTLGNYYFGSNGSFNYVLDGYRSDTKPLCHDVEGNNTCQTTHQNQLTTWRQPWTFAGNVQMKNSSAVSAYVYDTGGNFWNWQIDTSGQKYHLYSTIGGVQQEIAYWWNASSSQVQLNLRGSSLNIVQAPTGADLKVYSGAGNTLWLGDSSNHFTLTGGILTMPGTPLKFSGSTAGSTAFAPGGANCPAGNCVTPYAWLPVQSADGSTVYIPAFK